MRRARSAAMALNSPTLNFPINPQLPPAVLTNFIPVLHTNVAQVPVTNLVARPVAQVPVASRERRVQDTEMAWASDYIERIVAIGIVVSCGLVAGAVAGEREPLYGFSTNASGAQRKLEAVFSELPKAENLRQYMQRLSAHPHHVGSPYDKENAEWICSQMAVWGWDASIETFEVLFPTPKTRVLEMIEPVQWTARLQEPALAVDPTSDQMAEQLPTYNAYSTDGDVTGPLLYVNYGLPDDYKELARFGVSATGAVVIAKYGKSWRGVKPKVAAEHGAIGCILYSDPKDDGYGVDDVFPGGPMRNTNGVQRGSCMDFPSTSPGDPLTPGYGSVKGARRLTREEARAITRIPVLPISSGEAESFLAQLKGPVAPEAWRGSLPITYHLGAGPAKVHLKLEFNWDQKMIYNVIGRIQGSSSSEEWVIRGNHHDAWVNGAADPVSGQACFLEEARSIGQLHKGGWKPVRTIVYCAWDGEEPGLIGSTEWVETHADELRRHAVAYVNSDATGRGFLKVGGSHILEHLVNAVAQEVADPEVKMSAGRRWRAFKIAAASNADDRRWLREHKDVPLTPLGSGSDYTGFLDFLGIPCLNLGFDDESNDEGVYHSIYDDYFWYSHYADTNFAYGRALAQTIGTTVLRLANAEVIPFEFVDLADVVQKYTKELQNLLKTKREEIEERNLEFDEDIFVAVSDPQRPKGLPEMEATPPELNFAPLQNAANRLTASAKRYQKAVANAQPGFGDPTKTATVRKLNQILIQSERQLTDPAGLPRRPWYKHLLYAPGVYSGYGAKTMAGIREGIELGHYSEAEGEIARVAKALNAEADLLDSASALLNRSNP
jgi:N-acetylated-alpha-linked acidic dipeptidase